MLKSISRSGGIPESSPRNKSAYSMTTEIDLSVGIPASASQTCIIC